MQTYVYAALLAISAAACAAPAEEPEQSRKERIHLLEARVLGGDEEAHAELKQLYAEEAADTSIADQQRLTRVRYLAEAAYAESQHQQAYELLRRGIADFQDAGGAPEAGLLMAEIAIQRLREPETAELIFATIRAQYPQSRAVRMIPPDYPIRSVEEVKEELQRAIFTDTGFDRNAAIRYGKASMAYTALEKDADVAAADHIAAGRVLEEAKAYPLALQHYREVQRRYPQYSKVANAAFLEAFVVHDLQGDKEEGRRLLEQYLRNYPNHTLAADAKALLQE